MFASLCISLPGSPAQNKIPDMPTLLISIIDFRNTNTDNAFVILSTYFSNAIVKLSEHFKKFKKDKHSTLGLTKSVNKRKKLLVYLKRKNSESYQ